ncbi:MAG: hypothetical protein AAFY24_22890 [Pseudomonadota bacterium]
MFNLITGTVRADSGQRA